MLYDPASQRILLPARTGFIVVSLLAAFAFNLAPWRDLRGVPDLLALVVAFWSVHQPRKVGIGIAWIMGLLMDAANAVLFGQHALAYAVLAFLAHALHRRILWFGLGQQALHILPLLLLCQFVQVGVGMIAGGTFPGWTFFLGSFIAAALWPLASFILLAPQRAPESVDETRPI